MTLSIEDELALRDLTHRYASGVDRRDVALFLSAFAPDGQLAVVSADDPDRAPSVMRGHGELAKVPERITRFPRTFHVVANTRYWTDDDGTRGEVYCSAHHLIDDRTHDLVMLIRYDDRYRRDEADGWTITERRVVVQWQDLLDVAPPRN